MGAHHDFLNPAVFQGAHTLKIRVEPAFGDIVGMADIAADHGLFSANFTDHGHVYFSVISIFINYFFKIQTEIRLLS